jgi:hypothetical protein
MRTIQIVGAISLFALSVSEQRATAGDSVLSLKSAADYLWVGENSAFHLTKAFTLEAWVNVVSSLNEEQTGSSGNCVPNTIEIGVERRWV